MCYQLNNEEINLLLAHFNDLRSQAALTPSLAVLELRLRLSESGDLDDTARFNALELVSLYSFKVTNPKVALIGKL
jgi:hypothetical protein